MTAGFVYLEHPDITGGCQVPDDPDVVAAHEAKGWQVRPTPVELDPDAPNTGALPANAFVAEQQAAAAAADAGPTEDTTPDKGPEQPATRPAKNRTAAPADDQNGE